MGPIGTGDNGENENWELPVRPTNLPPISPTPSPISPTPSPIPSTTDLDDLIGAALGSVANALEDRRKREEAAAASRRNLS
jgi:hypothetical protein